MQQELLAQRVRSFGTSVFSEFTALAVAHQAVNLGQGFPDFAGPAWVKQAAADAIAADLNQYAPAHGLPRLRQAIAGHWARCGWRTLDPDHEITVTSGATEAIFSTMMALLDPGAEVICFEPSYDLYAPAVTMAGGRSRYVRLHPPQAGAADELRRQSWWFDPAELAAAFTPQTRVLLLNTPHNPTGKVFRRNELEQIAALCCQYDVTVVTDEVYDQIVYAGAEHLPIALLPGMWERTLTVNSTGKTFSMTGWKIGYAVGPAHLNHAVRQAHQWVTFATATPLQQAMAVALETAAANGYYAELCAAYTERRDRLAQALTAAGMPVLPVEGSFFLMVDTATSGFSDDVAFCRWLTCEVGVAAIPPSAFYAPDAAVRGALPPHARFCFAKRLDTIDSAAARLAAVR